MFASVPDRLIEFMPRYEGIELTVAEIFPSAIVPCTVPNAVVPPLSVITPWVFILPVRVKVGGALTPYTVPPSVIAIDKTPAEASLTVKVTGPELL